MIATVAIISAAVMVALAVGLIVSDLFDLRDEAIWTLVTVAIATVIGGPIVTLMVAIINVSAGPAAFAVTVTVLCGGAVLVLIQGIVSESLDRARYRRWVDSH